MDEDIDNLQLLILMIEDITPEYDFKLNELIRIIREKKHQKKRKRYSVILIKR